MTAQPAYESHMTRGSPGEQQEEGLACQGAWEEKQQQEEEEGRHDWR